MGIKMLQDEILFFLHSLSKTVKIITFRRLLWAGYVARVEETGNASRILARKHFNQTVSVVLGTDRFDNVSENKIGCDVIMIFESSLIIINESIIWATYQRNARIFLC